MNQLPGRLSRQTIRQPGKQYMLYHNIGLTGLPFYAVMQG